MNPEPLKRAFTDAVAGGTPLDVTLTLRPEPATDRELEDDQEASELAEILGTLPGLSLTRTTDAEGRAPRFVIERHDQTGGRIGFIGVPRSLELGAFEEGLHMAAHGAPLPPAVEKTLAHVGRHTLTVLTTPTCPFCAAAVRLVFRFALSAPGLEAWSFDASSFPDAYAIRGLPATLLDEVLVGRDLNEMNLLESLIQASTL